VSDYHRDVAKDIETWCGTKDAAEALGITTRTLYRLIDDGDIPAYKLGRVLRVRRADLDAYLERCKIQPGDLKHLYPPREGGRATEPD
jgi:excisionase family DNA binding protein